MSIQCQELNEGFFLINFVGADQVSNIISSSRTKSTTNFSAILLMSSFQSLLRYLVKLDTRYICSTKIFYVYSHFSRYHFLLGKQLLEYILHMKIFLIRMHAWKIYLICKHLIIFKDSIELIFLSMTTINLQAVLYKVPSSHCF